MEHYINYINVVSDITYKSEPTPTDSFCIRKVNQNDGGH
jgi:hypothetical protein